MMSRSTAAATKQQPTQQQQQQAQLDAALGLGASANGKLASPVKAASGSKGPKLLTAVALKQHQQSPAQAQQPSPARARSTTPTSQRTHESDREDEDPALKQRRLDDDLSRQWREKRLQRLTQCGIEYLPLIKFPEWQVY